MFYVCFNIIVFITCPHVRRECLIDMDARIDPFSTYITSPSEIFWLCQAVCIVLIMVVITQSENCTTPKQNPFCLYVPWYQAHI